MFNQSTTHKSEEFELETFFENERGNLLKEHLLSFEKVKMDLITRIGKLNTIQNIQIFFNSEKTEKFKADLKTLKDALEKTNDSADFFQKLISASTNQLKNEEYYKKIAKELKETTSVDLLFPKSNDSFKNKIETKLKNILPEKFQPESCERIQLRKIINTLECFVKNLLSFLMEDFSKPHQKTLDNIMLEFPPLSAEKPKSLDPSLQRPTSDAELKEFQDRQNKDYKAREIECFSNLKNLLNTILNLLKKEKNYFHKAMSVMAERFQFLVDNPELIESKTEIERVLTDGTTPKHAKTPFPIEACFNDGMYFFDLTENPVKLCEDYMHTLSARSQIYSKQTLTYS